MARVPHANEVDRSLRAVRTAIQHALKGLNLTASQFMAKGDYASAETLAATGREIQKFQGEIDAIVSKWREVRGGAIDGKTFSGPPLWGYYQPILKVLVEAGGEARRADVESGVGRLLGMHAPASDAPMAGGRERWQVMVRRARKHLVSEGWIEDRIGVWRITEEGRRAAEAPLSHFESTHEPPK